jgi:hypothetical protein
MVGLADFSLPQNAQNGSGIHPAHRSLVLSFFFFPGEKWLRCEVNHTLLLSAEVKEEGNYISSPPVFFHIRRYVCISLSAYVCIVVGPVFCIYIK